MVDITQEEKAFMERPDRHPKESITDQIIRNKGTKPVQGLARLRQRSLGGESTVEQRVATNPRFAMDAVVPDRGTEEAQRKFDSDLSPEEREREIRNAHARANIVNESRGR